ncbi:hypothetical protein, partial [Lonsdalea populi]
MSPRHISPVSGKPTPAGTTTEYPPSAVLQRGNIRQTVVTNVAMSLIRLVAAVMHILFALREPDYRRSDRPTPITAQARNHADWVIVLRPAQHVPVPMHSHERWGKSSTLGCRHADSPDSVMPVASENISVQSLSERQNPGTKISLQIMSLIHPGRRLIAWSKSPFASGY